MAVQVKSLRRHLQQNLLLKSNGVIPDERPSALPRLVLSFDYLK
jgi:hypothetical protein